MLSLLTSSFELGLITSLTTLSLFLSYTSLGVCDLSTDGSFTLGAVVGAVVCASGHPILAVFLAFFSGLLSGFVVSFLQTKMGLDSLLSGIVVNTALYSVNILIMKGASVISLGGKESIFTYTKKLFENTFFSSFYKLTLLILIVGVVVVLLSLFLKTRLGLSIRATGNNREMVSSSSINPERMVMVGLTLSNGLTALSGALLAFLQKSASITMGSGILTIALASLLIGRALFKKGSVTKKVIGAVIGALIFRLIYALALRLSLPSFMLKLVSSLIVVVFLSFPYLKNKAKERIKRKC